MKTMPPTIRSRAARGLLALLCLACADAQAGGPLPETSVVLLSEAEEGGSIKVTNTDPTPMLLTTTIQNLAEDDDSFVVATPPIARVEPGKTQLIRFMLTNTRSLGNERMKRVIFEGIPETARQAQTVRMTVRQNLPLLVLPKDLQRTRTPWTRLTLQLDRDTVRLSNPSRYVVRLDQQVRILPSAAAAVLAKPYILPGETVSVPLPAHVAAESVDGIRLFPATVYGYMSDSYVLERR
ncbi:fimbria/pilus chaperone family protein [Burkholderia sp. Cy-637]|uniref:fimbria/pilus chaperone family protein n=1 Tax=Burkholderia sp. Cy-637 TaxID=2608327 RepID=UPI001F039B37|nr:fimbria/pilus chaperone family protein [Burkholderia sp. Cy-637]